MNWTALTAFCVDVGVPVLREFGFPVFVALGAMSLVGYFALTTHKFVTGKLIDVCEHVAGVAAKSSETQEAITHGLERVETRLERCHGGLAASK